LKPAAPWTVLDADRAPAATSALQPDRVSRRRDLTAQAVNIVVGSSVFVLPGIAAAQIGAWAPVAILAATTGVFLVVLSFAEAAGYYTAAGGPYRYANDAFGGYVGAQIGVLYWTVRATSSAAVANVFATYLAEFWPAATAAAPRFAVTTLLVFGSAVVNIVGTRRTVTVLNLFTVTKMVALAALGIAAIGLGRTVYPGAGALPSPAEWARAVLLWIFAFGGFEATLITAGEARDPANDGPKALVTAVSIVAALYLLIQWVVLVIPGAAASTRPLADAARFLLGGPGAALVTVAALLATTGHVPGSMFAASRLSYAMAERDVLPPAFARLHPRFRTPVVSILAFGFVVWLLAISGSFVWNASLSAIARLIVYGSTSLAVLRLRHESRSTFRVSPWVHVAALLFCGWLIAHLTWNEAFAVSIVWLVGSALFIGRRVLAARPVARSAERSVTAPAARRNGSSTP
jgi:amino acid transporter